MDVFERIAKEIDPMAWRAWEVDNEIDTRRKVSLAKARCVLVAIRNLPADKAARAADSLDRRSAVDGSGGEVNITTEVVAAVWATVIDSLVESNPQKRGPD